VHSTIRVDHWTKILVDLKRIRVWADLWGLEMRYDSKVLPKITK
jgi:hypothetical protein